MRLLPVVISVFSLPGSFLYISTRETFSGSRSIYKSTQERVDSKALYGGWSLHLMDICSFLLVSFHFRDLNVFFLMKFGRQRESLTNYFLVLVTYLHHADCLRANLWDQKAVRRRFQGQNQDQILPVIPLSRHDKLALDLGVLSITCIETPVQWTQSATPVHY